MELLGILNAKEYETTINLTKEISDVIKVELMKKGLEPYDIKLEFGKDKLIGEILLIDELSAENMRVYNVYAPIGKKRFNATTGQMDELKFEDDEFYPHLESIDMYHRYKEGLAFYEYMFKECHKYGIQPLVTISHFDTPLHLVQKYGGWVNRKMVDFYLNLCEAVFTRYKDLMKYWITFNEINMNLHINPTSSENIEEGEMHPRQQTCSAAHHQLLASAQATKLAREINPENQVGCMLAAAYFYPYSPRPVDVRESQKRNQSNYIFPDVQAHGTYPNFFLKQVGRRRP